MRGRLLLQLPWHILPDFNPRPHAGATTSIQSYLGCLKHFNPRPHAGATFQRVSCAGCGSFQSTPPCGGDMNIPFPFHPSRAFQSTPPCGGDWPYLPSGFYGCISIHAPMRGRPSRKKTRLRPIYFNPRPHAGATTATPIRKSTASDFNPRPHAGATSPVRKIVVRLTISIHAPMRGRLVVLDDQAHGG